MKLHHIALTVNNLDESLIFYKSIFWFEDYVYFEKDEFNSKASQIRLNEIFLELWEFWDMKYNEDELNDIKIRWIRHIAFSVVDIAIEKERLEKKWVICSEIKLWSTKHKYFFISDPNWISIELYEE